MAPILAGLFLLSGISGLLYQSLWQRLLSLVFGVTVYATATVLASFMAGLALGSLLAARVADRVRRPLVTFGLVERIANTIAVRQTASKRNVGIIRCGLVSSLLISSPKTIEMMSALELSMMFAF